jgi:hypothetical protein
MDFDAITWPLTKQEWCLFLRLLQDKSKDLDMTTFFRRVAVHLTGFRKSMPDVTPFDLASVFEKCTIKFPEMLHFIPQGFMKDLKLAVQPVVCNCLLCGSSLELVQHGRMPFFYPSDDRPAPGFLYSKKCPNRDCGALFDVTGYRRSRDGDRVLYAEEWAYTDWYVQSAESVYSKKLFTKFDEAFFHMQASFQGFLAAHNHPHDLGEPWISLCLVLLPF